MLSNPTVEDDLSETKREPSQSHAPSEFTATSITARMERSVLNIAISVYGK